MNQVSEPINLGVAFRRHLIRTYHHLHHEAFHQSQKTRPLYSIRENTEGDMSLIFIYLFHVSTEAEYTELCPCRKTADGLRRM